MSPMQDSPNGYVTKKKSLADNVCSSLVPDAVSEGVCGVGDAAGGAGVGAVVSASVPPGSAPQHDLTGSDTAGDELVAVAVPPLGTGAETRLGRPFMM